MKTAQEIRDIIAETSIAGLGNLVEDAVRQWANCQGASVDEMGDIWIEGPQAGHWITDEKILEFWAWNEAN